VLQIQPLGMDLIEKARERGREACRLGNAHTAFRPRLNETAEKELSAQGIDSGRQRQQRFAKVPRADIALKQQLVFLDITDGAHPRQDQGLSVCLTQERLLQRARRAPRRGEDCYRAEIRPRSVVTAQNLPRQHINEAVLRRNVEYRRFFHLPRHYPPSILRLASRTASGVPTCSHAPSWTRPYSRPPASALS